MKRRSSTIPKRLWRSRKRPRLLYHERKLSKAGYKSIAGVDEAGRGPLAGPVVASAVILKVHRFKSLVNDSKKLSAKQRDRAYKEIVKNSHVGVGIVDEKIIDEINIYRATKRAMEQAISSLNIMPDIVIVDGNVKLKTKCPSECIIKGDSKSLSIASASIIAKVTRDRLMMELDHQYPQYGFSRHKGYPTKAHKKALKTHGPSPIHRKSYQPVREALEYL